MYGGGIEGVRGGHGGEGAQGGGYGGATSCRLASTRNLTSAQSQNGA